MPIKWSIVGSEHLHQYPGEVLVLNGLLSNAPVNPSWAMSLYTLKLYHAERLYKPNYAVQNFMQALCKHIRRPYHQYLSKKFSQVYDVFLMILRAVEKKVSMALQHDDPLYTILNFCPCCRYVVEGEKELKYNMLYSLDGGNSFKRFRESGSASRLFKFCSTFMISDLKVDKWKHVIKRKEQVHKSKRRRINTGLFILS